MKGKKWEPNAQFTIWIHCYVAIWEQYGDRIQTAVLNVLRIHILSKNSITIDFECCSAGVERLPVSHNFPYNFLELPAALRFSDLRGEVLSHEQQSSVTRQYRAGKSVFVQQSVNLCSMALFVSGNQYCFIKGRFLSVIFWIYYISKNLW